VTSLGAQIAFISLAALTLISAFFVVTQRNIVYAGFWLLPCFVGVAGLFAALEAHFFFIVQLLIYAGAILVLILFALMLTRDVMRSNAPQTNRLGLWAGLICAATALGATYVLMRHAWPLSSEHPADMTAQTAALGHALITQYAVPFEVASLLLLAALIGAVVMAKSEREPEPEPPPLAVVDDLAPEEPREKAGVRE